MDILSALKPEPSKLQEQLATVTAAIEVLGGKNSFGPGKKRHFSASARAKMAKSQRARWAKIRATRKNG